MRISHSPLCLSISIYVSLACSLARSLAYNSKSLRMPRAPTRPFAATTSPCRNVLARFYEQPSVREKCLECRLQAPLVGIVDRPCVAQGSDYHRSLTSLAFAPWQRACHGDGSKRRLRASLDRLFRPCTLFFFSFFIFLSFQLMAHTRRDDRCVRFNILTEPSFFVNN